MVGLGLAIKSPVGPTIKKIVFERTGCFGTCPAYRVTLTPDGTVTYNGLAYVKRKGVFRGTFWAYDFVQLSSYIDKIGFSKFKKQYTRNVSDQPGRIVTVVTDKGTQVVTEDGASGPPEFWALCNAIDGLTAEVRYGNAEAMTATGKTSQKRKP